MLLLLYESSFSCSYSYIYNSTVCCSIVYYIIPYHFILYQIILVHIISHTYIYTHKSFEIKRPPLLLLNLSGWIHGPSLCAVALQLHCTPGLEVKGQALTKPCLSIFDSAFVTEFDLSLIAGLINIDYNISC